MVERGDPSVAAARRRAIKSPEAFRTISEVAVELDVPAHVLRFWESKFSQIRPLKRGGRRRYYRPEDIELLRHIRGLLYEDGYTIKGVQKVLREQGAKTPVSRSGTVPGTGGGKAEPAAGAAGKRSGRAKLEAALRELGTLRDMLKDVLG